MIIVGLSLGVRAAMRGLFAELVGDPFDRGLTPSG